MFKGKLCFYIVFGVLITLSGTDIALGQYQIQHRVPAVVEEGSTLELSFDAPGILPNEVQDAFLFFRMDGNIAYEQKMLELNQSVFGTTIRIPGSHAGSLEYYIQIHFNDGSIHTYPANGAAGNPIRVDIVESRPADESKSGVGEGIEYTILSPEQGEEVRPEDAVIAITLFYDEGVIDTARTAFQLLLDGEDITDKANASPYFLTYVPEKLATGEHTVSLRIKTGDDTTEIVTWSFSVSNTAVPLTLDTGAGVITGSWMPTGQIELAATNQKVAGSARDILSGRIRLNGQKENIRYSTYGLLTSQEDPRLQPQNRYGAELYIGDWFELQAGHIYPMLSPLTIAGQRVQGVDVAFHPFNRSLSAQFIYGKLRRKISNVYSSVRVQPRRFNNAIVDTGYVLEIRDEGLGTFRRNVIGGRLNFEKEQKFSIGLNLLKIQDDTNSIDLVSDYRDLITMRPKIARELSQETRNKLEAEPNLLSVNGNPRPKGNFVAASDLMVNLHNNRIQFRADGAVSLLNEDISGGILSGERASELGFEIGNGVERLLDRLSWMIIINENMTPLPLSFNIDEEVSRAKVSFPTSSVAAQSELSFNYFNNNLQLQYHWVGPDFNSLANSTVRRDIAGYTISDRFRLFDNRIYVTLGYENLNDNVTNYKNAITKTVDLRSDISWYPIRQDLPRVSVGLMNRSRKNGVDLFNPYVPPSLVNAAVRNYETQPDTVIAPNARLSSTMQFTSSISQQFQLFGLTHNASLNYSLMNTRDVFFAYGAAQSHNLSVYLTNRFRSLPLDTNIGFSLSNTETGGGLTDINIFGFNVGGSAFLLDDKLNVDATLAFAGNKTEITPLTVSDNGSPDDTADDYYKPDTLARSYTNNYSYIFRTDIQYDISQNHAFRLTMRFTNVTGLLDGMQVPNDHFVQARYMFSF